MQERIRRHGSRIWRAQWPFYCEIVLFAVLDLTYEFIRTLIAPDASKVATAKDHANSIMSAEHAVGLQMEAWSQRVTDAIIGGRFITTWYYTLAYTPLFITFFLAIWFWRRSNYAFIRNWFWTTHAIALVIYWAYPLAPPRLAQANVVDTTKQALTLGGALDWFQHLRNDYAAMPSLHVGQSFLYALVLVWLCASWSRWRHLWWILPIWMAWVTMSTANHFLFDGFGGVLTVLGALGVMQIVCAPDIPRPWQGAHRVRRTDTLDSIQPPVGGSA